MEPVAQETNRQAPSPIKIVRDDDFVNLYANHIASEMSVWDLRVIFGILDQSVQPNQIIQHTAINIPWAQVKLATYFLQVAVLLHEAQNAKINIPPQLRPPDPSTFQDQPEVAIVPPEVKEKLAEIYRSFLATL